MNKQILDITKPFNDDEAMYSSWYKPWASTTREWVPADDETRFKKNLKENPDELSRYNWIDTSIDIRLIHTGLDALNLHQTQL